MYELPAGHIYTGVVIERMGKSSVWSIPPPSILSASCLASSALLFMLYSITSFPSVPRRADQIKSFANSTTKRSVPNSFFKIFSSLSTEENLPLPNHSLAETHLLYARSMPTDSLPLAKTKKNPRGGREMSPREPGK